MSRLKKINVAPGIVWVEAAEVGLSVLCGCPADAVKHLMRRGLIVPSENRGVAFETGPTAILLSDLTIQNGAFCNLAEFPVLQMLYRQGMILPGHPNNTGVRPLLIGLREQVDVQLQYIYRGNYGLVTREEMIEAGVTPEAADELMKIKLKFAFGHISHPRGLIDTLYVAAEPVEIRDGVMVERVGVNVFRFHFAGETVTVDLNLTAGTDYEPSYLLGMHHIRRDYFAVVHCGEGDGWDQNRPSMSSIVIFQGRIYLIDAGPNLQHTLLALGIGSNEIEGIFHTHAHDDHFAGLTTLMRADHRIRYFATPLVRASVAKKLAALLDGEEDGLEQYFDVCQLRPGEWNDIDGLEVMPMPSPHPVETSVFIFRAMWSGDYRSYAHFADIATLAVLRRMVTQGADDGGLPQAWLDRVVGDYATAADVKKIDVGGGLIHGSAADFAKDASGKIILSHTSRRLSDGEKEIGSGAPFGTVDVLIAGEQDFIWRWAFNLLRTYFPSLPHPHLALLLNHPLTSFNPETILIREGGAVDHLYLVLTGAVEMIRSSAGIRMLLSAGALVGEPAVLRGTPSSETYRAATFVQVLQLPASLYRQFVARHDLLDHIGETQGRRSYLRGTWLCGESLSDAVLNRIAQAMVKVSYGAGEVLELRDQVALIRSGRVERCLGGERVEELQANDFFGEERAVFDIPSVFRVRTLEPVKLFLLPGKVLRDVPVVRWKLFETFQRRLRMAVMGRGADDVPQIVWHDEYSVNIRRFDNHHRHLFDRANAVLRAIAGQGQRADINDAIRFLEDYVHFHFTEEQAVMEQYGYPDVETHKLRHAHLVEQVQGVRRAIEHQDIECEREVADLLRDWLLHHILSEDRKYSDFLNNRGVY